LPSDAIQFLSLDEALAIHERLIARFGGGPGVRDMGLLESALFRPRTGYYVDLAQMTAALFDSLIINHAFVDGNKRAAFFTCDTFLRLNGWRLRVDADSAHRFIVGSLDQGTLDYARVLSWVEAHLERL
jgi:death-on-curing protein